MPVYIIRAGDTDKVKIGFTADATLRRRLAKMQTDNHERLTVIRWLNGDENAEAALQANYAHLRVRGDWFRFCETMKGDLGITDVPPARAPPALCWDQQKDVLGLISHAGGLLALMTKLGVARTTILDWKRTGIIPAKRIAQINGAFNLPIGELLELASVARTSDRATI